MKLYGISKIYLIRICREIMVYKIFQKFLVFI